jgi:hypothetical protein
MSKIENLKKVLKNLRIFEGCDDNGLKKIMIPKKSVTIKIYIIIWV